MNRVQKLHILNTMYFQKTKDSLENIISSISKQQPGFDAIVSLHFNLNDETLDIKEIEAGIHPLPPSLEPDLPIENSIEVVPGEYIFMQMPLIDYDRIKLELLPFISGKKEGKIFIRIFKENLFEEVMQFIMPL